MELLARFRRPWLTRVMLIVTSLGSGGVCFPAYIFCLWLGHGSLFRIGATALIAEALLLPIIVVLRYSTRRERPAPFSVRPWTPWNSYGFPSHHAARSWLLTLIVLPNYPGVQVLVLPLASLICFSRLYLQKHYLSDVVAGTVLGICAGFIATGAS